MGRCAISEYAFSDCTVLCLSLAPKRTVSSDATEEKPTTQIQNEETWLSGSSAGATPGRTDGRTRTQTPPTWRLVYPATDRQWWPTERENDRAAGNLRREGGRKEGRKGGREEGREGGREAGIKADNLGWKCLESSAVHFSEMQTCSDRHYCCSNLANKFLQESVKQSPFRSQFAFWHFKLQIEMKIGAQMRRTVIPYLKPILNTSRRDCCTLPSNAYRTQHKEYKNAWKPQITFRVNAKEVWAS